MDASTYGKHPRRPTWSLLLQPEGVGDGVGRAGGRVRGGDAVDQLELARRGLHRPEQGAVRLDEMTARLAARKRPRLGVREVNARSLERDRGDHAAVDRALEGDGDPL